MGNIDNQINQAVITLGGTGSRLNEITMGVPKPLFKIDGLHTLERSIKVLYEQGITKFIWITNYQHEFFLKEAKQLLSCYQIKIFIHKEKVKKGEAGSLFDLIDKLDEEFIFLNGDIIFDIDIKRLHKFHNLNKSQITFVTHLTNHPEDSDCIIESPNLSINKYKFKNEKNNVKGFYLGNSGLSVLSKKAIKIIDKSFIKTNKELSLFKDIIINCHNQKLRTFSYNTSEYLKDMGTPKRLLNVKNDIKKGKVKSLSYLKRQKALFLDRDNTIIKCKNGEYILDFDQINLLTNRVKIISKIANEFDLVILITNQPQIAMGKVSWEKVIMINGEIIRLCQDHNLNIATFYLCPHHNHMGFKEEIKELKINCFCRKPLPGMFLKASYERNIDLTKSLLIGDSWRDKEAAENLKMKFLDVNEFD